MAAAFKIERDIPLPPRKPLGRQAGVSKYPFRTMAVGDSFFVAATGKGIRKAFSRLTSSAQAAKPFKFSVRTLDNGVRIWRIA